MAEDSAIATRGRIALYGIAAIGSAALVASVFLLWRGGNTTGLAFAAALPPAIVFGFIGLASRYPCRAMPLRRSSTTRVAATHIASAVAAGGFWTVIWQSWLRTLERTASIALTPDYTLLLGLGILLYLMAVAMHYLILEVEAAREAEDAALRYQVLAREAELKAFKAQIDPHFLFNSLNAVASLCGSRPQDARQMSQLLADFFRQTLRLGGLDRVTLAQEIDLVSRYLSIEKIRFGERLSVDVAVDEEAGSLIVPPLILQPLVENAVRHGIASMLEGGTVRVRATSDDGAVKIVVENPADADRSGAKGEGIGLANVRGRLSAFFGGRGTLRAEESEGWYRVHIEVPR
ncbi:MAG TPA: histidine kinase [Thermoanaerobaculia bacterium]|nr:histidine kinase [Thermoanaerobaculia bacterium]